MISESFETDLSSKLPVDAVVQKTLTTIQKHEELLHKIDVATRNTTSDAETHFRPIHIAMEPCERVYPQDMIVVGDNEHLRKVLIVLVFLCDEIHALQAIATNKFYPSLVMFGRSPIEIDSKDGDINDSAPYLKYPGNRERLVGLFMPTLQELANFVDRCHAVVLNLVQQLSSCYHNKGSGGLLGNLMGNQPTQPALIAHLFSAIQALGEMLMVLVTIDHLVTQNEFLKESWAAFKGMIVYARADPLSFQTSDAHTTVFERMLVNIDQKVLRGESFKTCIEMDFEILQDDPFLYEASPGSGAVASPGMPAGNDSDPRFLNVRGNGVWLTELLFCLRYTLDQSLHVLETQPSSALFERESVVACVCLYTLYRRLLPRHVKPDSSLHRYMWGVQKVLPMVVLCQKAVWYLGEFLSTHAPLDIARMDPPNPVTHRRTYIHTFDTAMQQHTAACASQCSAWFVLAEAKLQASVRYDSHLPSSLDLRGSILLKGLALAQRAAYLATACVVMHATMQVPMSKSNLHDVACLLEYTKAMEHTFHRKAPIIAEYHLHTLRGALTEIFNVVQVIRQKTTLAGVGSGMAFPFKQYLKEFLGALTAIEHLCLTSDSLSRPRQATLLLSAEIVFGFASSTTMGGSGMPPNNPTAARSGLEKECLALHSLVLRANALSSLPGDIKRVCDCSWLYHHLDILPPVISAIYAQPTDAHRLTYTLAAFADGVKLCDLAMILPPLPTTTSTAPSPPSPSSSVLFLQAYRRYLCRVLQTRIIQPLCREIETNLRLHIHTKHLDHMALESLDPQAENLRPLRPFLEVAPLRVLGCLVDIKTEVVRYLDRNFYHLTTIALHDWRTYSDMRSLAVDKLGLVLMDNFLPMGSLEQGLDVLQIMRNIHIFVSRFSYNMNMQQFVEFKPDKSSKHLNTIKIQSIAASIRQHGLGVLNTAVNFTYQFLAQKFNIFSQFLYDDYIKAHLSREHRWFKKHKNDAHIAQMYPYERAAKFVKDIRRLGVSDSGRSFLDQFRVLITEIGNALGYVRMVRSAAMYYCSEAAKYLPELDSSGIVSFAACAGSEPFVPPTSSSFWTQNAGGGAATVATPSSGTDTGFSFHSGTTTTNIGGEAGGSGGGSSNETDKGYPIPGASLGPATVRAGENLDEVIATLLKNFGAGSDYFKVLVKVFQSVLLDTDREGGKQKHKGSNKGSDKDQDQDQEKGKGKDKNDASHDHLKNFYMIVPALCISWTDAALQAKDNMFKATRSSMHGSSAGNSSTGAKEIYYTDDGFAMGVAYCLAILKQTRKSDALHWTDTMRAKIAHDARIHEEQQIARNRTTTRDNHHHSVDGGMSGSGGGTSGGGKKISAASSGSIKTSSGGMTMSALSGAAASFFFGNPQSMAAANPVAVGARSGLGTAASSRRQGLGSGQGLGSASGPGLGDPHKTTNSHSSMTSSGTGNRSGAVKGSIKGLGKGQGITQVESVEADYEDAEEAHLLQKTGMRIEGMRRETEQLFYSMSGAGIFFKKNTDMLD